MIGGFRCRATSCHSTLAAIHLEAALESVSASAVASTTNVLQNLARVVAFPWLSDANKWHLLKTDGVIRPFIFQGREADPTMTARGGESRTFGTRVPNLFRLSERDRLRLHWVKRCDTYARSTRICRSRHSPPGSPPPPGPPPPRGVGRQTLQKWARRFGTHAGGK